jgi:hypothetical protein
MLTESETEALTTRLRQFKFAKEVYLLQQFRRHPDWRTAFERILKTRRDFFVETDDGQWVIPEYKFPAIEDAVDQEFIDEIIRKEATQSSP